MLVACKHVDVTNAWRQTNYFVEMKMFYSSWTSVFVSYKCFVWTRVKKRYTTLADDDYIVLWEKTLIILWTNVIGMYLYFKVCIFFNILYVSGVLTTFTNNYIVVFILYTPTKCTISFGEKKLTKIRSVTTLAQLKSDRTSTESFPLWKAVAPSNQRKPNGTQNTFRLS